MPALRRAAQEQHSKQFSVGPEPLPIDYSTIVACEFAFS
jgi:hypothetical protein